MKQNRLLAISLLAGAWLAFNAGPIMAQSSSGPSGGATGSGSSAGKSSEEGLGQSQTNPSDSRFPAPSGTTQGTAGSGAQSQSGRAGKESVGQSGSQSGQELGQSPSGRSGGAVSGSRSGQSDMPASGTGSSMGRSGQAGQWSTADVKEAQEALKSAGHDPGPIDGKMGPQTRQAIKAFQSSQGLKETGTLDKETAEKLGIEKGAGAKSSSSSERGSSSSAGRQSGAGSSKSQGESSSPVGK